MVDVNQPELSSAGQNVHTQEVLGSGEPRLTTPTNRFDSLEELPNN